MATSVVFVLSLLEMAGLTYAVRNAVALQISDNIQDELLHNPLVGTWTFPDFIGDSVQYTIAENDDGQLQFRQPNPSGATLVGTLESVDGVWFQSTIVDSRSMQFLTDLELHYDVAKDVAISRKPGTLQNTTSTRVNPEDVEPECPKFCAFSRHDSAGNCHCPFQTGCVDRDFMERCASRTFPINCSTCSCEPVPLIESYGTSISVHNAKEVTISRQGTVVESNQNLNDGNFTYTFDTQDMHREFIITAASDWQLQETEAVFIQKKNDHCGIGLFTTPSLRCSKMSLDEAKEIEDTVTKYLNEFYPRQEILRGFGVELELVGRERPKDLAEDTPIKAYETCFLNHTMSFTNWNWEGDITVSPLSKQEAKWFANRGEGFDEDKGNGFELVSPGPPHVLAGQQGTRSLLEVLGVLKFMGIQAGPSSGMHVHVNVGSKNAPGTLLTYHEVAYVWAAFAKYQFVIDEMLSPNRIQNTYAYPLNVVGNCFKCEQVKKIFRNIHKYVTGTEDTSQHNLTEFCNAALGGGKVCSRRYPSERYYSLNLAPLARYGTIEFRNLGATHDQERVLQWTLFVVAFVEHFGKAGADEVKHFFDGTSKEDLAELAQTQKAATIEELFNSLNRTVSTSSLEYFAARKWEQTAAGCNDISTTLPTTTTFTTTTSTMHSSSKSLFDNVYGFLGFAVVASMNVVSAI